MNDCLAFWSGILVEFVKFRLWIADFGKNCGFGSKVGGFALMELTEALNPSNLQGPFYLWQCLRFEFRSLLGKCDTN